MRMHSASAFPHPVAALLTRTRAGQGGALLVRAEPGLGTSTLLDRAAASFSDGTVLTTRGVAAETAIPYSGLHALLRPVADHRVTGELARALELAAVPSGGSGPVLAGFCALLQRLAAEHGPLLACVDDAHHLDSASREALGFAARRLGASLPAAMLIGRPPHRTEGEPFAALPVLTLHPLDDAAATVLLDRLLPESDPAVRETLLHEGHGNPGLLTDLAQHLTPAQRSGTEPLPRPLSVGESAAREAAGRLGKLPPSTRGLLLLTAAAHEVAGAVGTDVLLRAAVRTGMDPRALESAEAAAVIRRGGGDSVRFTHPLLCRAAYWDEPPARRRAAHWTLAQALTGPADLLLRLRHLAAAAPGPAPSLADALSTAAQRPGAVAQHGHAGTADALLRAVDLTEDEDARVLRLTTAAEHVWADGRPHRARVLLDRARSLPAGDVARGRSELMRGVLELSNGVVTDARETLLEAARLLEPHDADGAREAVRHAIEASWTIGDTDGLQSGPGSGTPLRAALLDDYCAGMSALLRGDQNSGAGLLRRVIALGPHSQEPGGLLRAMLASLVLGETAGARELGTRTLAIVRARGLTLLEPRVLEHLAYSELRLGRHSRARAHALEGLRGAARTGQRNHAAHHHAILAMTAAAEGDADRCARHAAAVGENAGPHGLGVAATLAAWSRARCDLALGRPHEAAARLEPVIGSGPGRGHCAVRLLVLPCFIEAAALAGEPERARPALEIFTLWAAVTDDPQAPAQLARCRALLAGPDEAAVLFADALVEHGRAQSPFDRARTQLLLGMTLRRLRRPGAARNVLRDALFAFEGCGARVWAERAAAELRATGEAAAGPAGPPALAGLTPQQLRIARHVAEGATNREVAARLSVSPRTVDHHLRNVFSLLGIRSRVELTRLLATAGDSA
ncbi:LuxR C-terminal-related transcriptional regulator [Streptomyces sp. ACA25]|uniref:LuxR C-terminal-related transcriptional regulator n=1 Tax=Streptomyces sp. ACA25 TaxID=3022596 RepID=UPI002306F767|nr:LuxR family transcriptional regulator [Streptomyces sp. ACA25]MDB1088278.1 LuxR C-terminal-related transcriptional regulator [Streptomyces sp. ACA25]